ncbi:putative ribonuclease H-like domain-containing protein [Tanacetum coccineum]
MYSVDMKNIVPKENLTCLVAKATLDESMLWHRRLGHINFKTINKLVKDNLVRGLPSKRFENDQTCVVCLKGKQHKALCKSKVQKSITQPLFMLHIDLFGPTFVSNLMNKKYCLMVTDDYNRFTWVFFLASKDETSGILKNFITEIENLVDKKVKIIRCDNGTEFKNRVMNEFCEQKGIKREYSVARTPQQNGVAKRINRTLIEAARTIGRTHSLSFMRPFGCHVSISNTLDHLGKFNGKSNDGFFVSYSLTRDGPKWLFDLDILTKLMNYVPVIAGTNSNDFAPSEVSISEGSTSKEADTIQEYIMMPLWKDSSLFDCPSMNVSHDEPEASSDAEKRDDEWKITVVILVRDRCPRGKDNLPRLPIRTNIVRLATPRAKDCCYVRVIEEEVGGGGLEGDEEGLENELYKLESSYGVLVCPCDVVAKKEEKGVMWLILRPRME